MTYIPEEMKLAVKNGAAWLDEVNPMWVEKINLGNLVMMRCDQCVLGQVFHSYSNVKETDDEDWANTHGFRAADGNSYVELIQEYKQLGMAWTDYIEGRG